MNKGVFHESDGVFHSESRLVFYPEADEGDCKWQGWGVRVGEEDHGFEKWVSTRFWKIPCKALHLESNGVVTEGSLASTRWKSSCIYWNVYLRKITKDVMLSFVYSIKDSEGCNQTSLCLNECGKMPKKWIQINEMLHCIYMPLCLFDLLCLTSWWLHGL